MTRPVRFLLAAFLLLVPFLACRASGSRLAYPAAERAEVVDVYHGEPVADPYRWLEEMDSPEVRGWIRAQNDHSLPLLRSVPQRDAIEAHLTVVFAALAIARHLDALHQTDLAVEQLEAVVAMKPAAPYGSLSLAYLQVGEARDRLGERDAAVAAYRAALSTVPRADPNDVRTKAAAHLRRAPDARRAEAYRLALEGWRRFEGKDMAGAGSGLERSIALNGSDPVARYRYGRVLQAQEAPTALAQYELVIGAARACPPTILATAYVDAARLHGRAGHRDQAIAYYRTASTLFGAAEDTRTAARRALTRLQAK